MGLLLLNLFFTFSTFIFKFCINHYPSLLKSYIVYSHRKLANIHIVDHEVLHKYRKEILTSCVLVIVIAIHLLFIILKCVSCEQFSLWFVSNPKKGMTIEPSLPEIISFYLLITDFSFDIILLLDIDDIMSLSLCSLHLARNFHINSIVCILYLNLRLQLLFSLWRMLPSWLIFIRLIVANDVEINPGQFSDSFFSFCNWNINSIAKDNFQRVELLESHNTIHRYDLIALCEV